MLNVKNEENTQLEEDKKEGDLNCNRAWNVWRNYIRIIITPGF